MNKKFFSIWITIAVVSFGFFVATSQTKAEVNSFTLNFSGSLLFATNNAVPGQSVSKTFSITNNEASEKSLHIFGRESGANGLNGVLNVSIAGGNTTLDLPMTDFLTLPDTDTESNKFDNLGPNETKTYNFLITFDQTAGNEYQGRSTDFDVTFGVKTGAVLSANDTKNDGKVLGILNLPNTGSDLWKLPLVLLFVGLALRQIAKKTS